MPTIEPRSLHPPPQALPTLTALVTLVSCRFRAYLTYLTCLPLASEVLFCFPGGCSWAFRPFLRPSSPHLPGGKLEWVVGRHLWEAGAALSRDLEG